VKSVSPYTQLGSNLIEGINEHLESRLIKNTTLENFFSTRIKIKDFYRNIVWLKANALQKQHQATKEKYLREGRKPHFLLLKYRRGGLTTWEQATSYRMIATQSNSTCITLADTDQNTRAIFRMVALMLHLDPRCPKSAEESKTHIGFPNMHTYFGIGTAGAKALSRGDTIDRVHGSEVAWWRGDVETIENLVAGLTEAARFGEVVFETTANGASGWFYETYKEAMDGGNPWIPLFYPWYIDPINYIEPTPEKKTELLDTMSKEELEVMEKYDLTFGQMLWRREKKFERKKLFSQEYPESWEEAFLVRGYTFFDAETLANLSRKTQEPIKKGNSITIWENPIPGDEYCAGADAGEGLDSGDFSVCGILHKKTGKQVAVVRGKWRPEVFARKCFDLCVKYNKAAYACEINNHGHSVMNTMINTLKYKNLYYRIRELDKDKFGNRKKEKVPGWNTNPATRPILLDELNEAIENNWLQVNDKIFISEAKTFVDRGGKYEADAGQHDDSIFAWGIAWQCRKQKKKTYINV
jgi:hypothetical protein